MHNDKEFKIYIQNVQLNYNVLVQFYSAQANATFFLYLFEFEKSSLKFILYS